MFDFPNYTFEKPLITDTHAHYDNKRFEGQYDELFKALKLNGVDKTINCSCDIESSKKCLELSKKYSICYTAVGYHPSNLPKKEEINLSKIKELAGEEKVVAIGEIGLDYYWHQDNKELQKEVFCKQIDLSKELNLPVIIHDRDAHADTLEILKQKKPKGVVHCFSGSTGMAEEIIKLGLYIGIGGVLTFKNAKRLLEVANFIPLDKILLETDAPYMAPEPHRGKTNNSALILYVANRLAEIKGLPTEEILKKTHQNAQTLFNF